MWEDSLREREFDDLAEGSWTFESEVSQHLSIDIHPLVMESSKESRVRRSIHSSCSIDPRDPKLPEYSLPSAAITIRILHPFVDVVLCDCENFAPRSPRPLRLSHDPLPTSVGSGFILCTRHN